jgi:hypothetical protein
VLPARQEVSPETAVKWARRTGPLPVLFMVVGAEADSFTALDTDRHPGPRKTTAPTAMAAPTMRFVRMEGLLNPEWRCNITFASLGAVSLSLYAPPSPH